MAVQDPSRGRLTSIATSSRDMVDASSFWFNEKSSFRKAGYTYNE